MTISTHKDGGELDGDSAAVLTPADLIGLLDVQPEKSITIAGLISNLRQYPAAPQTARVCYGDIEAGGAALNFAGDSALYGKLVNGVEATLSGVPKLRQNKINKNKLEVQLSHARLIGDPKLTREADLPEVVPNRDRPRIRLSAYVRDSGAAGLGFLVSSEGETDILGKAQAILRSPIFIRANFLDSTKFLASLELLVRDDSIKGIVIACGGHQEIDVIGDSIEVAKALIGAGKPFYIAMGHNSHRLFLDRFADDVFDTPQDFGDGLRDRLEEKNRRLISLIAILAGISASILCVVVIAHYHYMK
jgi:exodeoxyribonuclease VII large subunit